MYLIKISKIPLCQSCNGHIRMPFEPNVHACVQNMQDPGHGGMLRSLWINCVKIAQEAAGVAKTYFAY